MNKIITTNSNQEFVKTICETIKEEANKNIEKKGEFTFVLSGGRTPKVIFEELATNYKTAIEWNKVHFFWLDERCVEPTHEDSNYKLAFDHLISKLDDVGSIHRIKGELAPTVAANIYRDDIFNFFGYSPPKFDFILLGMGEDGHIASIFPLSREFKEKNNIVMSTNKKYNGYYRITLGLNIINKSFNKLLMINSTKKYKIYKKKDIDMPISFIKQNTKVVVVYVK